MSCAQTVPHTIPGTRSGASWEGNAVFTLENLWSGRKHRLNWKPVLNATARGACGLGMTGVGHGQSVKQMGQCQVLASLRAASLQSVFSPIMEQEGPLHLHQLSTASCYGSAGWPVPHRHRACPSPPPPPLPQQRNPNKALASKQLREDPEQFSIRNFVFS